MFTVFARPGARIAWLGGGGGAEINFGGAREVYLYEFEGGTGAREVYLSVDQTKKVKKGQKKRSSVKKFPQILVVVSKFLRFSTNSWWRPKKRSSSQNFYEILCESTKITKKQFFLANSRAVNTNLRVLGLDLPSGSPELVNFFGAQSSLGGAQFSFEGAQAVIWGARPWNASPWRRAWFLLECGFINLLIVDQLRLNKSNKCVVITAWLLKQSRFWCSKIIFITLLYNQKRKHSASP